MEVSPVGEAGATGSPRIKVDSSITEALVAAPDGAEFTCDTASESVVWADKGEIKPKRQKKINNFVKKMPT